MNWISNRKASKEGFPAGFSAQRIRLLLDVPTIAKLPPPSIAEYFRKRPDVADRLIAESESKRFTPSTFIGKDGDGYEVGWYTSRGEFECVQHFSDLADAATDYLLFSIGKARWTVSK